jgi:p-aminobenzoyl-glutamate transporter AbgT
MQRLPARRNSVYTSTVDATLRGNQAHLRDGSHSKQKALRVAAIVCLILLALLAVVQVMHVHASDSDADHCTLCVAMHSVVPILIMLIMVVLVRIEVLTQGYLEVRAITRYWHPNLFIRPPPVSC